MRTQRAELESFSAVASKPSTKPNKHREPGDDSFSAEQRFLDLFRSNPESFVVRKSVAEKPGEDGKLEANYTTLSRQVSLADVAAHLDGKKCLVLKPDLPDGTCAWASLDNDHHDERTSAVIRERIEIQKLPLYPFLSKSGGLHPMIFFRTPHPISAVQALLKGFAAQLDDPNCEIFPKPVTPGKKPYGIAMLFFGERDEFESFQPVLYDGSLNGHQPQSGGLSDLPAYGVKLPNGVDFGELLQRKLKCDVRHEAGGISYDYHGINGQTCLIQGSLHRAQCQQPPLLTFLR